MTEADDRKPRSDEARYDPEITSEFAVPEGLEVPKGGESETTSEFAVPEGLQTPQPPSAEPEGSAFSTPSTYSAQNAPAAFTPATGVPLVSLVKDAPWQDRMRTMLRMPVTERPAPEVVQREEEGGPAVPRVLDLTLRIGGAAAGRRRGRGGRGGRDVRGVPVLRPGPVRAERHLHAAVDLAPAVPGGGPGDGVPDGTAAGAPTTPGWRPSSGSWTT